MVKIKKISEGAEAFIYSTAFLGFDAIIKSRVRKGYRLKEIDESIRLQRTKDESRIIKIAYSNGINAPSVLLVDKYNIFMTRINGRNLNRLLDSVSKDNKNLERITFEIGIYAAKLHNINVAHGDFTPANILVDGSYNVYLIDFGLSMITNSVEEKALDLLLMKRSLDSGLFGSFVLGYGKTANDAEIVLDRMYKIERRGRYQIRTLQTV